MIVEMLLVALVVLLGVAVRALIGPGHRRHLDTGPVDQTCSEIQGAEKRSLGSAAYWALVVVLLVFGTLAILSIGVPFLLTGLTLSVMAPYRKRAAVFWPAVVAVLALSGGFLAVAPFSCATTVSSDSALEQAASPHTTCSNLVGIDYSGSGNYNPSLMPALLAGIITAAVMASLLRLWLRRRQAAE